MPSPIAKRVIADALSHQRAILKFISPNDAGLTGSHQCGFYLPKSVWPLYSPHPPKLGRKDKSWPAILWPDGRETRSCVTWYGRKTRREYRLTCFGPDFPYLTADSVGDLLVLIPKSHEEFIAYILDKDDDIKLVKAALGIEILEGWGVYTAEAEAPTETANECIARYFRNYVAALKAFPSGVKMSEKTREALEACAAGFSAKSVDDQLLQLVRAEYQLFRLIERQMCQPGIYRLFRSVDDFLKTASSIMNRRKARAGRSFENHFEALLRTADVPFDVRAKVDGKPDILIPGTQAYKDNNFPVRKLCMVGLKRTCKDRWRQVLNEAERIPHKHILTLQQGISKNQLREMHQAGVILIVPKRLHRYYPDGSGIKMLTVRSFIAKVKGTLN